MEPKLINDKECFFCHGDRLMPITLATATAPIPDVICAKCGALYYSLQHADIDLRGVFTGKIEPLPNEKYYKQNTEKEV